MIAKDKNKGWVFFFEPEEEMCRLARLCADVMLTSGTPVYILHCHHQIFSFTA